MFMQTRARSFCSTKVEWGRKSWREEKIVDLFHDFGK